MFCLYFTLISDNFAEPFAALKTSCQLSMKYAVKVMKSTISLPGSPKLK